MVIEERTYTHISYQGCFDLAYQDTTYSEKNTFVYVTRIIQKWIRVKFPNLAVPYYPTDYHQDIHSQSIDELYDYDCMSFSFISKHTDPNIPGRMWITEAEVTDINGQLRFGIKNQYTSNTPEKEYELYNPPKFVQQIANKIAIRDADENVEHLNKPETTNDIDRLYNLVTARTRRLPVVVISETGSSDALKVGFEIDGGYHIAGDSLRKH